jgi:hypothetical protein
MFHLLEAADAIHQAWQADKKKAGGQSSPLVSPHKQRNTKL